MGRILTVTNSNNSFRGARKKTVGREIVIGQNAIKFIAVAICAVLAMVYLTQSTAGANRSVKIRDLDDKKQQLQLEKESLQVEQTRLNSLKEIDAKIEKKAEEVVGQTGVLEEVKEVGHLNSTAPAR